MIDNSAKIHQFALIEDGVSIGANTYIWAFTHVLGGAIIGCDCNICDYVFVESKARIGDRVTIKCGVQVWDETNIEDDVFIGPNVTFTNDRYPVSGNRFAILEKTIVRKGASIGGGSTILPGIEIGEYALIGAGTVVTHNIPAWSVVVGNPGRVIKSRRQNLSE